MAERILHLYSTPKRLLSFAIYCVCAWERFHLALYICWYDCIDFDKLRCKEGAHGRPFIINVISVHAVKIA